jgi:CDP-diacylglycerol--serine O-phosphatidyltransferase
MKVRKTRQRRRREEATFPEESSQHHSLMRIFPNMITLLGLCAGLSSLRFALVGKWELALTFIAIAAFIDAMDGRLARMMNITSTFGAQLDSLADFFNFGVAPPLILYLWITYQVKGFGWALVLFFAVCAAIRLARFNTNIDMDGKKQKKPDKFFVGIPSPAGAGLALFPMILQLQWGEQFIDLFNKGDKNFLAIAVIAYTALVALGMASRLPTFTHKRVSFPREYTSLVLVFAALVLIWLVIEPWLTLSLMILFYILLLPVGVIQYYLKH